MLYTNLKHIETAADQKKVIKENENVVIICGRMEPASITVFRIAEELEKHSRHIKFYDMEFDNPETSVLKNTLEYYDIAHIPLIGYFKQGNLVNVSLGVQSKQQIANKLNKEFS
jgi:thioredoxin 1